MLWKGRRESGNVVDQRSFGAGKLGGGALVIGAIIYYFMGGNPLVYLAQNAGSVQQAPVQNTAEDDQRKGFASVVLADTEDVWNAQFQKVGKSYPAPKMILFRGRVETDCGRGTSSSGPFYCPADRQVYLDLSFFDEMKEKLGAGGDFAQAYVIAH
ncbi:MAG: metalloprotease, partial [Proteobacteria bacterium]